ncbi:hypothetical protein [Roseimicrobium sp. ORNL1]|uniref:hypothetical protein n=1 Tax=Roseimicrobium sp. ORNL1 TaxID=2711231 RepID=UPI0013E0F019|nr:hypothetical protein [Roseimicrobium sp. ORNL1]QIF02454.1 hypothetical protein G5S37_13270 [Roseimicrobium sp. ORNL1]
MRQFLRCFEIDTRSLRVFRAALGILMLADSILRLGDFSAHYASDSMFPISRAVSASDPEFTAGSLRWSLMFLSESDAWQVLCLVCYGLSGILLVTCQRFVLPISCLAWIFQVSVIARAPTLNNGGDTLQKLLLFWNMLIALEQLVQRSREPRRQPLGFATAGLLLQVCLMYWSTALLKSHPVWREHFTAVQASLSLGSMQTSAGRFVAQFPLLTFWATKATLLLEEVGPFLALSPPRYWRVRTVTVALFIGFHLALLPTLLIGWFPLVCIAAWTVFIPKEAWDYLLPNRFNHAPFSVDVTVKERPIVYQCCVALVTIASFASVVSWNVQAAKPELTADWFTRPVRAPSIVMGLNQRWNLFASRPSTRDGWMLAVAQLQSGQTVDLLTGKPPVFDEPVEKVASHYRNWRWRKHLVDIFQKQHPKSIENLHSFLIRDWNAKHTDQVLQMSLIFRYRDSEDVRAGILQAEIYPKSITPRPTDNAPKPSNPTEPAEEL